MIGDNVSSNDSGVKSILGDPRNALIRMSIPLIVSLFFTSIYNVVDAMWVAGIGVNALAGVGFVTPIFTAIMGIGNGLGAGSASSLSKYIGENNKSKADNGSIHTMFITLFFSLVTTLVLWGFLKVYSCVYGCW